MVFRFRTLAAWLAARLAIQPKAFKSWTLLSFFRISEFGTQEEQDVVELYYSVVFVDTAENGS